MKGIDWSAGIPACMSAKHEKRRASPDLRSLTPLKKRAVAGRDACAPVALAGRLGSSPLFRKELRRKCRVPSVRQNIELLFLGNGDVVCRERRSGSSLEFGDRLIQQRLREKLAAPRCA